MSHALSADEVANQVCLACGLCCDGTLFKDVELQAGDDASALRGYGLALTRRANKVRFPQPCSALEGCVCRVYHERPARCRQFECLLFRAVQAGEKTVLQASRTVRRTRARAERVRKLLASLGDLDEAVALSVRFKRIQRRFECEGGDDESLEQFAELTLAVHDLNVALRADFFS
jgi:Fe-S-cluster containining protein